MKYVLKNLASRLGMSFLLILQSVLSVFPMTPAYAQAPNYDLAVQKLVKSATATSVIYRVEVVETNGFGVSQVSLDDFYSTNLTFSGVVGSTPMFSDPNTYFINDTTTPKLRWEDMTMPASGTEWIDIEFTMEEGENISNKAEVFACNNAECSDQFITTYGSVDFVVDGSYTPPVDDDYDLTIQKMVGDCSGIGWTSGDGAPDSTTCANNATTDYEIGDEVYFTMWYANNSTVPVDYIVITDEFDLRLEYDSVTYSSDTGDIPLTDPGYVHFANYTQTGYPFSGDYHNVLSFSDGFSMAPGDEGLVTIKFTIANGFSTGPLQNLTEIGVATNLSTLGTQYFYGGAFGPTLDVAFGGEADTTNNSDNDQVEMAPFDLAIDKEVISVNGDGSAGAADIDWGDTFVYRLNLYNDGPTRTDVSVNDIFEGAGDVTLDSITYSPGLTVGYEPDDAGHLFSGWNVTAGGDIISEYPLPSCDSAGNCGEFLWRGNISLPAGDLITPAGYIDVELSLSGAIGCIDKDPYELTNTAFISLTDNRKNTPALFPIYSPSDFLNMTDDTDETDQSNNAADEMFELLPDQVGCGAPSPSNTRPYDLSVLKTVDKTNVCPGEEIKYTMNVYNSGSVDKYVYLSDEFDAAELSFNEICYDNQIGSGERYQCWYDTPAYDRYIHGTFDLFRVELLDSSYWFSHNESFDINHYITNNAGCATMFNTSSPEYVHYTTNLVLVSDAYADQLAIEYAAAKAGGADEATAVTSAQTLAGAYIRANIATIAPGYDPTLVQPDIATCYQEQFYDRKFFDQGMAPALALSQSTDGANRLSQACTDLSNFDADAFRPCLQLGANGSQALPWLVRYFFAENTSECPLIDMYVNDNNYPVSRPSCSNGLTQDCEYTNIYDLQGYWDVGKPYLLKTFGTSIYGDYPIRFNPGPPSRLNLSTEVYVPKFDDTDRFQRGWTNAVSRDYIHESNSVLARKGFYRGLPELQMSRPEYYDYIGDPTTKCDNSYIRLRGKSTGINTIDASGSTLTDLYGLQKYEKAFACDHPVTGIPNITFAGPTPFDMPDTRGAELVTPTPTGFGVRSDTATYSSDSDLMFYAPVNTGSTFEYTMTVDKTAGGKTITNIGEISMCVTTTPHSLRLKCSTATYKTEEVPGDTVTPGVTYASGYYDNGGSNNRSSAEITVLDEPACEAGMSLTKTSAPNTATVGVPVVYELEYCNDTATAQNDLVIDMTYPANWDITAGDIVGAPAGSTATVSGSTISFSSFSLAANAGCATIELTFTPEGPSGDADIIANMTKLASGVCGDQNCTSVSDTMVTNPPATPNPVVQNTKKIKSQTGTEPGDTVTYELKYQNTTGGPGYLEVYDYYNTGHLTYVSSNVTPDYVDSTNGAIFWDHGNQNNNATVTILVTFEINAGVEPGTTITNGVEHRLNVSQECECGIDPIPDNDGDDALFDEIHDLALIKTLTPNNSPYKSGDVVTFEIYIENQGEVASSGLVLTDYIPTGLTLTDTDWTAVTGTNQAEYDRGGNHGLFAIGANDKIPITFTVNGALLGTAVNWAEISEDTPVNKFGYEVLTSDIDSSPDSFSGDMDDVPGESMGDDSFGGFNTTSGDNYLSGDGIDDEDDHDPELITISTIDVAIEKTLITTGTVIPGDDIVFRVEVFNQSPWPVYDVLVEDYIPTDMSFVSSTGPHPFALSGTQYLSTIDMIGTGMSEVIEVTLKIDPSFTGSIITNNAEILAADDDEDPTNTPLVDQDDDLSSVDGSSDDTSELATDGDHDDEIAGSPGTGDNTEDEDSYDLAQVMVEHTFDLAIEKYIDSTTTPAPYYPGDNVTFEINVMNQGTLDATDIVVTDYIPSDMTFVSSPDFTATAPHTATIGSLASGTGTTLSITLQIMTGFQGTLITNNAEITTGSNVLGLTDQDDDLSSQDGSSDDTSEVPTDGDHDDEGNGTPGTGDNVEDEDSYDPAQVTVGHIFDLALDKVIDTTATPGPYEVGDNVTFTVNVYNQGTLDATGVVITDYLPSGMNFVNSPDFSATPPHTATIANLPTGTGTDLSITLQIDPSFTGTVLTNNAEITDANNAEGLTDQDNDLADIDGLSDDITELSTDNNTDDEAFGTPGTADDPDDIDDYDLEQVFVSSFDLAIEKIINTSVTPGPYAPGDDVTFEITVYNQGNIDATDIIVTDYIPTDMTFVNSLDFSNTAPHIATIDALSGGDSTTLHLTLRIDTGFQGTTLTNNAEITGAENDEDLIDSDDDLASQDGSSDDTSEVATDGDHDDEAMGTPGTGDNVEDEDSYDPAQVSVGHVFDLALDKVIDTTATPGPYELGDNVTFTINVYNQGSLDATGVVITDYLPSGMNFVSSSDFSATAPHTAMIANLATASMESLSITLQIDPSYTGAVLTNNAEITDANNSEGLADEDNNLADIDGSSDDTTELPTDNDTDDEATGTPGTADNPDDVDDYDLAQVEVSTFDLAIQKMIDTTATPAPYMQGDNVTFTITVYNQGNVDATDIIVTDYLPTGMNFVSSPDFSGTAPHTATIGSLAGGADVMLTLTAQIDPAYQGTLLTNNAEITDAYNTDGLIDQDDDIASIDGSSDDTSEVGTDNDINDDGMGTPGATDNVDDEDSYDPAQVVVGQIFDLAMTKVIDYTATPGPFVPGGDVSFSLEVCNQGTLDAYAIELTDYIPTGMTLNDAAWTDNGDGTATYANAIPGPLAPEACDIVPVTLQIDASNTNTTLVNRAEISAADDDEDGENTPPTDIDSTPDADQFNGPGETDDMDDDNVNDEDGKNGGDEDDHDLAEVSFGTYDLALDKVVSTAGPYTQGGLVTYDITVYNQGSLPASNIEITDHSPISLTLTDTDWTNVSSTEATYVIPGPIAAGSSVTVQVSYTIIAGEGSLVNRAEISDDDADDTYGLDDDDSTPDGDNFNSPGETDDMSDDNTISEDGKNGGDEDDHDPALIELTPSDNDNGGGNTFVPEPEQEEEVIEEQPEEVVEFTEEELEVIEVIEIIQDNLPDSALDFSDEVHSTAGLQEGDLPSYLPATGAQ